MLLPLFRPLFRPLFLPFAAAFRRRLPAPALAVLAVALLGLTARPAHAQFFTSTTGLASPAGTVTFTEVALANGTPLTNQFAPFGVTFSSGVFYNPQNFTGTGVVPPSAGNFAGNGTASTSPFSVFFTAPQTSAALAVVTNSGTSTFEALNNGIVVSTGTAATDLNGGFFGFKGLTFNQIRLTPTNINNSALIDSIQLGSLGSPSPAPEPSSSAALGVGLIGLAGLAFKARRRRLS